MKNTGKEKKNTLRLKGGGLKNKKQRPKYPAIGKIQKIDWDDHCSAGTGWFDKSEARDQALKCESVGWVVKENTKIVTLAQNKNSNTDIVADLIVIVKSCITKRKTLR